MITIAEVPVQKPRPTQDGMTLLHRAADTTFVRVPGAQGALVMVEKPTGLTATVPVIQKPETEAVPATAFAAPQSPRPPQTHEPPQALSFDDRKMLLDQKTARREMALNPDQLSKYNPLDQSYLGDVASTVGADLEGQIAQASVDEHGRPTVSEAAITQAQAEIPGVIGQVLPLAVDRQKERLYGSLDEALVRFDDAWKTEIIHDPYAVFVAFDQLNTHFDALDCPGLAHQFGAPRRETLAASLRETALAEARARQDSHLAERLLADQRVAGGLADDQRAELEAIVTRGESNSAQATGAGARLFAEQFDQKRRLEIINAMPKTLSAIKSGTTREDPAFLDELARLFSDPDDIVRQKFDEAYRIGAMVRDNFGKPIDGLAQQQADLLAEIEAERAIAQDPVALQPHDPDRLNELLTELATISGVIDYISQRRDKDSASEAQLQPGIAALVPDFSSLNLKDGVLSEQPIDGFEEYAQATRNYNRSIGARLTNILPLAVAEQAATTLNDIAADPLRDEKDLTRFFAKFGDAAQMINDQLAQYMTPQARAMAHVARNGGSEILKQYNAGRALGPDWIKDIDNQRVLIFIKGKVRHEFEGHMNALGIQPENQALGEALIDIISLAVLMELGPDALVDKVSPPDGKYSVHPLSDSTFIIDELLPSIGRALRQTMNGAGVLVKLDGSQLFLHPDMNAVVVGANLVNIRDNVGSYPLDLPEDPQLTDEMIREEYIDSLQAHGRWQTVNCGAALAFVDQHGDQVTAGGVPLIFPTAALAQREADVPLAIGQDGTGPKSHPDSPQSTMICTTPPPYVENKLLLHYEPGFGSKVLSGGGRKYRGSVLEGMVEAMKDAPEFFASAASYIAGNTEAYDKEKLSADDAVALARQLGFLINVDDEGISVEKFHEIIKSKLLQALHEGRKDRAEGVDDILLNVTTEAVADIVIDPIFWAGLLLSAFGGIGSPIVLARIAAISSAVARTRIGRKAVRMYRHAKRIKDQSILYRSLDGLTGFSKADGLISFTRNIVRDSTFSGMQDLALHGLFVKARDPYDNLGSQSYGEVFASSAQSSVINSIGTRFFGETRIGLSKAVGYGLNLYGQLQDQNNPRDDLKDTLAERHAAYDAQQAALMSTLTFYQSGANPLRR